MISCYIDLKFTKVKIIKYDEILYNWDEFEFLIIDYKVQLYNLLMVLLGMLEAKVLVSFDQDKTYMKTLKSRDMLELNGYFV